MTNIKCQMSNRNSPSLPQSGGVFFLSFLSLPLDISGVFLRPFPRNFIPAYVASSILPDTIRLPSDVGFP